MDNMNALILAPTTSSFFGHVQNETQITSEPSIIILVSDNARRILQWIIFVFLLTVISIFGIIANTINIICFVRQGLKDPVNVSLLGLAISDLGGLVMALLAAAGYNPLFQILDVPVDMMAVMAYSFGPLIVVFTGTTSWITALITLERCLCITAPLKVRIFVTPRRVTFIILCIFIILICTALPLYPVARLSWTFSPGRNRSVLVKVYTSDTAKIVETFSYSVNNGFVTFTAYFMIIICTVTLVGKLRDKAQWRSSCTSTVNAENSSKRDQRVANMVLMVSILFIASFTPICLVVISVAVFPDILAVDGPNQNLLCVYGGFSMVLQSANSAGNIFIYYRMSTKYRFVFKALFCCGESI